jgi:hypothetical protein
MPPSTFGHAQPAHHTATRTEVDVQKRVQLARTFALVVGATFLAVGVLGFIPGITSNYDMLTFAGHGSHAKLLGLFEVSILHNLVHLLFGVAGLAASRRARPAVTYLLAGGAIYLLLAVYGFVTSHTSDANFVPVNTADDWLHVGLGVAMIALGASVLAAAREAEHREGAR